MYFMSWLDCQQTHLALHMRLIKIKVNIWWESDFQFDYFPSLPLYLKSPTELPPCDQKLVPKKLTKKMQNDYCLKFSKNQQEH